MKSTTKQKVRNLLASAKLRQTHPRVVVLTALLRAGKPQSADQIAAKLASAAPDKVTIYRILETFVKTGIVHKVFLRERTWHFELADNCTENQCHPHFTCTNCGSTHCLTETLLPMAKSPHKGFAIHHQRVQLEGLCPTCNPTS
ncbi:MAG: Fur family transcriptional regulator [Planctomycetota bacterium]